jgi:Zn-dependent peptidase ImmA (M78 family)/transcriptional regulator with XRE-family HTH domain
MANSAADAPSKGANPLILEWARHQAAFEPEEVEIELKIPPGAIQAWEKGLEYPDIEMLRRLSHLYDVPFSYFFLKVPPKEPPLRDYRGVPEEKRTKLSRDTKLALREFRRLHRLARTLQEIAGMPVSVELGKAHPGLDPKEVAERELKTLGVTRDLRQTWLSKEEAYHSWRRAVEALGPFVFSLRMPSSECRGAAVLGETTYAILVNQNDAPAARSFTLLHEYYHLLLGRNNELMVCDQFPGDTETLANRFAALVLLPEDEFLGILKEKQLDHYQRWWPDDVLSELSGYFHVSRDVIAIRLENLEFAPPSFYRQKRERWDKVYRHRGGFARGGKGKKAYAEEKLGTRLFGLTLNAVQTGILRPIDAALYIGNVRAGKKPWTIKARDIENWMKQRERR